MLRFASAFSKRAVSEISHYGGILQVVSMCMNGSNQGGDGSQAPDPFLSFF
jgi:hypothetical protein